MRRYRVNNVCVQYEECLIIGMDSRHDIARAQVILLPSFFLPCTAFAALHPINTSHHVFSNQPSCFLQPTRPRPFRPRLWPLRIEQSSSCRHLRLSRDATHSAPSSLRIQPPSQSAASIPLQHVCDDHHVTPTRTFQASAPPISQMPSSPLSHRSPVSAGRDDRDPDEQFKLLTDECGMPCALLRWHI